MKPPIETTMLTTRGDIRELFYPGVQPGDKATLSWQESDVTKTWAGIVQSRSRDALIIRSERGCVRQLSPAGQTHECSERYCPDTPRPTATNQYRWALETINQAAHGRYNAMLAKKQNSWQNHSVEENLLIASARLEALFDGRWKDANLDQAMGDVLNYLAFAKAQALVALS